MEWVRSSTVTDLDGVDPGRAGEAVPTLTIARIDNVLDGLIRGYQSFCLAVPSTPSVRSATASYTGELSRISRPLDTNSSPLNSIRVTALDHDAKTGGRMKENKG